MPKEFNRDVYGNDPKIAKELEEINDEMQQFIGRNTSNLNPIVSRPESVLLIAILRLQTGLFEKLDAISKKLSE